MGVIVMLSYCSASGSEAFQKILAALRNPVSDQVLVAAHRGGYSRDREEGAPENTVANIEVAVRKGFDGYETDIRRTRDGVFVIVHDDTLDRETNGTGPVEAMDFAGVKALRKRYKDGSLSDEPVASLEDFLEAGKGRILFKADLKPGVIDHFDELAREIVAHGMEEQVILRTRWKDADAVEAAFESGTPRVSVMFQVDAAWQVKAAVERFHPETIQVNLAKGEALSGKKIEAIAAARRAGVLVEMHSYNDPALWDELIAQGVRMFHTTAPEETLEHLRAKGRHW